MRLKYYLRGLGIGVLVTTIILTIAGHNRNKISDEEMEARKAKWQPKEPKVTTGYLARYAKMVTSGNRGAILENK